MWEEPIERTPWTIDTPAIRAWERSAPVHPSSSTPGASTTIVTGTASLAPCTTSGMAVTLASADSSDRRNTSAAVLGATPSPSGSGTTRMRLPRMASTSLRGSPACLPPSRRDDSAPMSMCWSYP